MRTQSEKLTLASGQTIAIQVTPSAAERDVKLSSAAQTVTAAFAPVTELAGEIAEKFRDVHYTKASIEFGVTFSAESDGLAALIVKASGEASFTVTVEFERQTKAS